MSFGKFVYLKLTETEDKQAFGHGQCGEFNTTILTNQLCLRHRGRLLDHLISCDQNHGCHNIWNVRIHDFSRLFMSKIGTIHDFLRK